MKKIVCFLLAALFVLTSCLPALAAESKPSSWAEEGVAAAVSKGLVPDSLLSDYGASITRREFAMLVSRTYERLSGKAAPPTAPNPFTDTDDRDVLIAHKLGIVDGVGGGLFAPERNITRQEICLMLTRTVRALDPNADTTPPRCLSFADEDSISSWAKDSVKYLFSRGIMGGVGEHRIDPLSYATREQAILLMVKLSDQYPKFALRNDILTAAYLPENGEAIILVRGAAKEGETLTVTYDLVEVGYLSIDQFEAIRAGKSVSKYGEVFTFGTYMDENYMGGLIRREVEVVYSDCGEFYAWKVLGGKVQLVNYWYDPYIYKTVICGLKGTVTKDTKITLNSLPSGSLNVGDDWEIEYYESDMDTLMAPGTWSYQDRFLVKIENGRWTEVAQGYRE